MAKGKDIQDLISEKELNTFIHAMADIYSWEAYHQIDMGPCRVCRAPNYSKRIGPGFPDWVLAHENGRLIFAEAKSEKGVVSEDQKKWLAVLDKGADEVYIWRPKDMDTIAEILVPSWYAEEQQRQGDLVHQ